MGKAKRKISPADRRRISAKISKLVHEGMSQEQAVAAAHNMILGDRNPRKRKAKSGKGKKASGRSRS